MSGPFRKSTMRAFTLRSRRTLAILLAVVVLLAVPAPALSASSPSPGDPVDGGPEVQSSSESRAMAKWTYLLYMSADNNLEDEAILNFNQMEEVGSTEDVNIVLQLDRSPDWDETNGNWTNTRRYYVLHDTDTEIINSQLLDDMPEVDMGNADNLRDFVVWAVTNYPAERYYLDVWGHGGGWRDGTCNDYSSGSVIDTDELGQALGEAETRSNVTLDGLGFDQCLMAQMEVFYEIKQYGDVLVGAESLIPAEGYNYTRVMMPLAADPDMDASRLADVIVTTFFDEYGHDNDRAHSAVDAEELDARLAPAFTRMAQLLRAHAASLRDEIKLARDNAQTYSTLDYIDLGNFTEHLLLTLPSTEWELRQAAIEVRENITTSVVAEDHGLGRGGSTGVTFYFPRYGASWSYANIQMSAEGRWDEFLNAYFDRHDRPNAAPTVEVTGPLPGSVVGLEFAMEGSANDTDGNVTFMEWKFDRGPWQFAEATDDWKVTVSTAGLDPGLHRTSVRSRDDAGDYSPEVQFNLNVESKGLELFTIPDNVRTSPGGMANSTLVVSAFGDEGGQVELEVVSAPAGWSVGLPFTSLELPPRGSSNGTLVVNVDGASSKGTHQVIVRAWVVDAPLIQAFVILEVVVTDPWADLGVADLTFFPENPKEEDEVTVNFSVRNTGLAPALSFDVEVKYLFDLGVNASMDVLFKRYVNVLAVGEELEFSFVWTANIGLHEFLAIADDAWNNTDLDRSDNIVSRTLLLKGHAVMLGAFPRDVNVTPGELVHFSLLVRNEGNLWDTLVLSHVNSTLGWEVRFNSTIFITDPKETHEANMWVDVPEDISGGTIEWVTLRLASTSDLEKSQDITLSLLYPEVFGLSVSLDREKGTLGPLATDSFNITIENGGNGYESYALEYPRQLDHLFISAVNDTVLVAPGSSTVVEVFFSSLDTDVGGQSFGFSVKVRSNDNATILETLSFNVTVARVFSITGVVDVPVEGLSVLPNTPLVIDLVMTSHSNYPLELETYMASGLDQFEPPAAILGPIGPGTTETFSVVLVAKSMLLMGSYDIVMTVHEAVNIHNTTSMVVQVEVERVDDSSLKVDDADASVLSPGVNWGALLLLKNDGNHPETYTLNTSYEPKWLLVELSDEVLTLDPYSEVLVNVTVRLLDDEFDAPEMMMLVVNANPANHTDGAPKVVLDIALDVPPAEETVSWVLIAGLLAATVVVLVLLVYMRQKGLRS